MKRKILIWFVIFLIVFGLALYIDYTAIRASSKTTGTLNSFESFIVPRFGLDIRGGARFVLEAVDSGNTKVTQEAMQTAVSVIQKRVNSLGISEATVVQEGGANWRRIDVELPGWKDPEKAKELIGQTALLEFKDESGKVVMTGEHIKSATVQFSQDPETLGQPVIAFELDAEGTKIFADITKQNIGKAISIYLDNKLLMSPTVQSEITEGTGVITGNFTKEEAANYAALLRSGALPVKLNFIEEDVVGPTLGSQTIRMAVIGAVVAFILIIIYMIIFYGYLGVLSAISLLFYVSLELAVLFLIHATLSLPAIGGAVLSLGMAVDINIIVFERMKDELKSGKSLKAIIGAGFSNALRTVIDSNLTVLVGAGVLFYFGTAIIKGFAVTTTIGLLCGFISGVFITRLLVETLLPQGFVKRTRLWGI